MSKESLLPRHFSFPNKSSKYMRINKQTSFHLISAEQDTPRALGDSWEIWKKFNKSNPVSDTNRSWENTLVPKKNQSQDSQETDFFENADVHSILNDKRVSVTFKASSLRNKQWLFLKDYIKCSICTTDQPAWYLFHTVNLKLTHLTQKWNENYKAKFKTIMMLWFSWHFL